MFAIMDLVQEELQLVQLVQLLIVLNAQLLLLAMSALQENIQLLIVLLIVELKLERVLVTQ
jgi:hypothetical protein